MVHLLLAVIYISFISLGLPDSLLGSAWPAMYPELGANVSWAGFVSMIIALGTIVSSLLSDRLVRALGPGRVTALSVATTAAALLGFGTCDSYWQLCLWAVPYGLGAGSVDAALNNYVALHYTSRHMSWLHCMWGLGATVGPAIMGWALSGAMGWNRGYRIIGLFQFGLTIVLVASLPMWKSSDERREAPPSKPLSLPRILEIPGAKEIMAAFFCYCALEQTAGLWAGSYLVLHKGVNPETAAFFGGMFYVGITLGRAVSGFLTLRFNDRQMIRMGFCVMGLGIGVMLLPMGEGMSLAGLILIGLGCAPVYPCIIHSTPDHFGPENSQALIGVQMASAYTGTCLMPPLFGLLADDIHISLLPGYLLALLVWMTWMYQRLTRKTLR